MPLIPALINSDLSLWPSRDIAKPCLEKGKIMRRGDEDDGKGGWGWKEEIWTGESSQGALAALAELQSSVPCPYGQLTTIL